MLPFGLFHHFFEHNVPRVPGSLKKVLRTLDINSLRLNTFMDESSHSGLPWLDSQPSGSGQSEKEESTDDEVWEQVDSTSESKSILEISIPQRLDICNRILNLPAWGKQKHHRPNDKPKGLQRKIDWQENACTNRICYACLPAVSCAISGAIKLSSR